MNSLGLDSVHFGAEAVGNDVNVLDSYLPEKRYAMVSHL